MVRQLISRLSAWPGLGRFAERLAPLVRGVFSSLGAPGQTLKNGLNGVWIGHPLHPPLTDIPLGAWTTAVVLDVLNAFKPNLALVGATRVAIAVGVVGAVAAAVAGVTDWSDTDGGSRRIGLMHGVLNLVATVLLVVAAVLGGRDPVVRHVCMWVGYLIVLGSAYLGGHLVFDGQIGVNHASGQVVPDEFTPIFSDSAVHDGVLTKARLAEISVLLVRAGSRVCALADTCAHLGGPLSEGTLVDGTVICPWHGSRFVLTDGSVVNGPSAYPQPCFETRAHAGQIEVRMPRSGPEA
jgi:nitrite reductase/ring-hydroxylating ferredoxin subunit/uncharacterized membrane protein